MAAILSSVRSSQRTNGSAHPRRSGAAHHVFGRHHEVDVDVVIGRGHHALVEHLQRVHRRHHDRVRVDQPGFRGDRELEVAEAATLAEPRAGPVDRDAAGHDEVDGLELVDVDRAARCARRALDRARGARIVGEVGGVEEEERVRLGQTGHRHVHDLAVDERALADGPLRRVGVRLHGRGRRPFRRLREETGRRFRAHEVRDAVRRLREAGDAGLVEVGPHALPQAGLGRERRRVPARVVVVTRVATSSRHRTAATRTAG